LGDANSSAVITLPGSESFKYVVMPMRIWYRKKWLKKKK
jgi:DNA polymerase-3 subunit beta